jgi:hypothetical protein
VQLQALEEAGSDLSQPHPLEFTFYFASRDTATAALPDLQARGYTAGLWDPQGGKWRVVAVREAVPTLESLAGFEAEMEEVASAHEGEYDGWGSEVVD